jgi:hypothetical protein
MFVRLLALPLAAQLVAQTDGVPTFDVKPSCEGAARANYMAQGSERLQSCIASEHNTRDQLAKNWSSFPPADRATCVAAMHNFNPTYTELATCLEMKRDLRTMKPVGESSTTIRVPGGTHRQPRSTPTAQ